MTTAADCPVREGDILAGKYRVERVLGQGGMGVVVAAQHVTLNQRVAMKFLLPNALSDQMSVDRFLREARSAVQIQSEHVARVIDVGTLENGAPFMVMEFLQGQDLSQMLQQRGPLSIEEMADYILQACEALAEAHSLGIVHRDLKPANLFLTRRADGTALIKVLDFGISKAAADGAGTGGGMTATGMIFGSPLYMSPEQMKSAKDVDQRTDIWALGVIMYELLTGRELFIADTLPGIVARIVAETPAPMSQLRPDSHPELDYLLLRCLEKNREHRVANVAELARGLQAFAPPHMRTSVERIVRVIHGQNAAAVLASPSPTQTGRQTASMTNAAWGTTNSGAKKSSSKAPIFIVAGAFAFMLIAAGAVFAATRGKSDEGKATANKGDKTEEVATEAKKPKSAEPEKTAEAKDEKPAPEKTSEPAPEKTSEPAPTATAAPTVAAKPTATGKPATTTKPTGAAVAVTATPTAKPATTKPTNPGSLLDDRK